MAVQGEAEHGVGSKEEDGVDSSVYHVPYSKIIPSCSAMTPLFTIFLRRRRSSGSDEERRLLATTTVSITIATTTTHSTQVPCYYSYCVSSRMCH